MVWVVFDNPQDKLIAEFISAKIEESGVFNVELADRSTILSGILDPDNLIGTMIVIGGQNANLLYKRYVDAGIFDLIDVNFQNKIQSREFQNRHSAGAGACWKVHAIAGFERLDTITIAAYMIEKYRLNLELPRQPECGEVIDDDVVPVAFQRVNQYGVHTTVISEKIPGTIGQLIGQSARIERDVVRKLNEDYPDIIIDEVSSVALPNNKMQVDVLFRTSGAEAFALLGPLAALAIGIIIISIAVAIGLVEYFSESTFTNFLNGRKERILCQDQLDFCQEQVMLGNVNIGVCNSIADDCLEQETTVEKIAKLLAIGSIIIIGGVVFVKFVLPELKKGRVDKTSA